MKYYQLFFNASECGLSGNPGFDIRTATEGIPQEFITLINGEESLRDYQSGEFNIPSEEIFAHPERISEFPKTFYYRRLQAPDGRMIYLIGRIVSACFDFPFYQTGVLTRPGNLVDHLFLFEQKPDAEVFDLFFEDPAPGSARFLPVDWSPRKDNPEMAGLMLGKPQLLPVEEKPFRSARQGICEKAFTLFFQYLSLRKNNRPLMVRTKADESGEIVAGFMRLLPARLADEITFVTNHQDNGVAKGLKITFVNEYYPNQIYTTACDYVDLLDGEIVPSTLEKVYRQSLKEADASGNVPARTVLAEWICSDVAARNINKPQAFNLALFNYAHHPEQFNYEQLDGIDGLIGELSTLIGRKEEMASRLNAVLSERFVQASSAADFKKVIELTEKCRNAGIPVSGATESARQAMTGQSLVDMASLSSFLSTLGETLYGKYADTSKLPGLGAALPEIVSGNLTMDQKKALLQYLEKDPGKRVACYVDGIRKAPAAAGTYQPFLEWDKASADAVDWLSELKDSQEVDAVASLLFDQLQLHPKETREQLSLYAGLSEKNATFKSLVKKNAASIYSSACTAFESRVRPADFEGTLAFIKEKVRPFIQEEKAVSKRFDRLCRVMQGDVQNVQQPEEYWNLAVKMNAKDAQQKLIDACFRTFDNKDSIYGFVDELLGRGLLGKQEIVDHVVKLTKSRTSRVYFWTALKRFGGYSGYESIRDLGRSLGIPDNDIEAVFREKYKAEYKAHKREVSRRKLKHFLKKKPVWISGIVLLLALVAALLFLTPVGKKVLGQAPAATPPVEEPADSSQTTPPDSTALPGVPEQSENNE